MQVVPPCAAPPAPAPYATAETAFAETKAYLSSREALEMSESDLERELHRRGQELMRKLLEGHLDQRSPGEAAGPVEGADGVERPERRVHDRRLETIFGTVNVERLGYARAGHDSLHPLDASLNLPAERYSLEVRRRVAEAAASRSFDEALYELSRNTGAEVPKRQAEQLAVRAAEDFDAFYEARRAAAGEPSPEESVVVLTFDGKGVVLHREDLREATRKAAERRRQQREQLSPFNRLRPGEKKHSKRMATVAAVYSVAPLVRSAEDFLQSLMPRQPGDKTKTKARAKRAKTPAVRPARWRSGSGRASNGSRGRWSPRRCWKRSATTPSGPSTGSCSWTRPRHRSTSWRRALTPTAYFGEVEHAFRGCGTRISAKWNARRSAATLSGRSLPFGSRGAPEILPVPPAVTAVCSKSTTIQIADLLEQRPVADPARIPRAAVRGDDTLFVVGAAEPTPVGA